jgi:hypothetical protein
LIGASVLRKVRIVPGILVASYPTRTSSYKVSSVTIMEVVICYELVLN